MPERVALVTGGGQGIGAAIVRALAGSGMAVATTVWTRDGDPAALERITAELEALTGGAGRSTAVELDVRDTGAITAAVQTVTERLGQVDVLVNNAGTNRPAPALEVTEADWDLILDTNLTGLFFTSQAVARTMAARGARAGEWPYAIVNIASQMGLVGAPIRAAYCASKAGVVNLTRVLAIEWASLGIRVNAVAPTFIHTPLADAMLADAAFNDYVHRGSPMATVGEPEDVAAAVCFLCSPEARLVTGHTLAVDGGWTAW